MKKMINVRFLFFLSLLQLLPYFLFRENTPVPVNDTMDVYVPQYKLTSGSEYAFCGFDRNVPQIMNGLNRDLLVSDMSVIYLLFFIFSSFWAFTFNLLLIKIVAFAGMFLFLRDNFSMLDRNKAALGAFLFSCIPFFPFFGIGVAGQPLLVNSLIKIHKRTSGYTNWLVLLLFPFYSSLVFTNIFIVFGLGIVCAYLLLSNKKFPLRLVIATALFLLLGVLVDIRLFHANMSPGFMPHRLEFDFGAFVSQQGIKGLISAMITILSTGIFHVETFYSVFVFILLLIYFLKFRQLKVRSLLFAALVFIVCVGLLFGLTHSSFYAAITNKLTFLKAFQVDRFYTLLPFLYFLVAAVCVNAILERQDKRSTLFLSGTIALSMAVIFLNSFPIKKLLKPDVFSPTYAEYYDAPLLDEVKQSIPGSPDSYRLLGVGIDPQVLQYNGFYTLDAYLNIYPLSYKHQFRPVIVGELEKSPELKAYFDAWGNRCYIFSAEIGKDMNKQPRNTETIPELKIDTQALKAIYNKEIYLLSTKTIGNSEAIGLQKVKDFHSPGNKYRKDLVLYKVI
jgi:hypothetical protein